MAKCPNCGSVVRWDDPECANCQAIFTGPESWRPIAESPEEAAQIADLPPTKYEWADSSPDTRHEPDTLHEPGTPPGDPVGRLPFSAWWPVLAGALLGLAVRLVFVGKPGGPYAAMMASFIYLAPALVGATTVYLAERKYRRSWAYYFWAPLMANVLFVVGTLLILIEGLICAAVIVPMFAVVGMVGGVIMGVVCRVTNWPRRALYSFAVLPLVLGGLEGNVATPSRFGSVERRVVIQAGPEAVWRQIMNASDIRPEEVQHAWIFRIGVPLPLGGVVEPSSEGPVRKIRMGRDVHFDQVFAESRDNRFVRWTYRLYPDSFPPYALDDHVVVGGYYFDVKDTSYTLTPVGESTELKISMGYRVTTQFNWYAEPLARYLLGNFEEVVLDFYRARSESLPAHPAVEPTSDGRG